MGRHGRILGRLARDALSILRRMFIICLPKSIGKRFPRSSPESSHPPVKIPSPPATTFSGIGGFHANKEIDARINIGGTGSRRLPDGEQRTGGDSGKWADRLG